MVSSRVKPGFSSPVKRYSIKRAFKIGGSNGQKMAGILGSQSEYAFATGLQYRKPDKYSGLLYPYKGLNN
jgi:hypothetical protein